MSCTVLNIANGKESVLHPKLVEILGSEQAADVAYAKISGPEFMERFGNWEYNYKNPTDPNLEKIGATMVNGEPKLFLNKVTNQWFFKDKNKQNEYLDRTKFSEFTAKQVELVTNHLLYRFVLEKGKRSFNQENDLKTQEIMESIDNSIAAYKKSIKGKSNEAELLERIDLVEKNKLDFKDELISYVAQLGIKVKERITDAEGNVITEVAEEDRGGGLNIKESHETNSKDTATVNTKIFLSQIENEIQDENGNLTVYEDGFLNVPSFADFNDVWTTLQKMLVDKVGYGTPEAVVDIFDIMYKQIEILLPTKPWAESLLNKLDYLVSNGDTNKINEFVQAFNKTHLNFYVTEYDGGAYTVINATATNSRASQITNKWNNKFFDKYVSNNKLSEEGKKELEAVKVMLEEEFKEYNKLIKLAGQDEELQFEALIDGMNGAENSRGLLDVFEHLGMFEIEGNDVLSFIAQNGGEENALATINSLFDKTKYLVDNMLKPSFKFLEDGSAVNVFNTESTLKNFAEAIAIRLTDISDSSVLLNQGKSGYSYTNPTYVSNKINEWRADPEQLDNMSMDPSRKNSLWLAHLRESKENRDAFKAGLDSSFKSKGKNDGVENTKITLQDNINANLVQMLNGKFDNKKSYFPTIIAADKSRRMLFQGLPFFNSKIQQKPDGTTYIHQDSMDVLIGYFEDEYNRMKKVTMELEDPDTAKIVHYHTKAKNGLRSQIFPEFDPDGTDPRFRSLRTMLYGDSLNTKSGSFTSTQRKSVQESVEISLRERLKETKETLEGIDGLSRDIKKVYNNDMTAIAGDYFMNGLISSVEYTKLFSGDPAYYKNTADLIKRIPSTYTDGLQLRLDTPKSLIFNQATVNGVEVASRYVDKILASVTDKKIADAYKARYDDKGKQEKGTSDVNTTDAQAWITPRRWKFLKQRLGQWGPQHDKVFSKMMKGQTLRPDEMKIAAQPLKGVYFEINDGRPVYLKYSQAVLLPGLVAGTPMQAVYDKMVNDPETGKPYKDIDAHKEVHEVITIDGVKVGAVAPTSINIEGTTDIDPNFELNPVRLNNRGWKLQQDLPTKLMHETNLGSQIQKNILEGISTDLNYSVDGIDMSGKKLVERIHGLIGQLSDFGKKELTNKFGIDQDGKMTDQTLIYAALIQEFKDRGGNENIVSALQKGMKFDAIPQIRGRVESIFMSIMNKALIKISTEGGSFIQVSPFGLETIGKDSGIQIVSKNYNGEALLPPRIENGKVLPGQAMIPHSKAVEIFKKAGVPFDANKLDASALELITYRIPNQGMSSNDYLEIVGILPPGVGDSIIVYDGLPAKTGSDFDIDKLFAMNHSLVYNEKTGMVEKLTEENREYGKGNIEKKLVQNDLFMSYKAILNSPLTYDNMMRSIDGAFLKNDIDTLFPAEDMKNMQLFSPLQQLKTKNEYLSGKFGVAQTANQLVDHVSNQTLDLRFDFSIGIGNKMEVSIITKDGAVKDKSVTFFDTETQDTNSIATNLSAFLNAYVDIAKDPYISRGNHNSVTANTAFMLIRSGVPLKWVNRFIGQPILKELVELSMAQGAITSQNLKVGEKENTTNASPIEFLRNKYGFNKAKADAKTINDLTEGVLKNNIKAKQRDRVTDAEVLNAWEFLSDKAKSFGEAVMAAKTDTKGVGGSNVNRIVNANKIRKVINDGVIINYESKTNGTALETYENNSLGWVKQVIRKSELFLSGTKAAEDAFNAISLQTDNGEFLVNEELGKAIDSSMYSYIMSGTRAFRDNIDTFKILTRAVPKEILKRQNEMFDRYQEAVNNDEAIPEENFFLKELEVNQRDGYTFIGINNKNKPTYYENEIYRGWMQLYSTYNRTKDGKIDYENIHPDRKLAIDLVKYAFTSSGFQNNLSQFFTHIPHEILRDLSINRDIMGAIQTLPDIVDDSRFIEQFQRHSKNNKKAVKAISFKSMEGNYDAFIYKTAKNESQEMGTATGKGAQRTYPRFIKATQNFTDQNGIEIAPSETYLYEMQGTVERTNWESKKMDVPIYTRTYELGLSAGKYKLFEYSKGSDIAMSKISGNNIPAKVQTGARNFLLNAKKDDTFKLIKDTLFAQEERVDHSQPNEKEDEVVFAEKIEKLKSLMDVEVIMDETVETSRVLAQNDPRTQAAGKPVILINPNQLFKTTAIHEFGHIFIDSFPGGLNNPRLKKVLKQLQGTQLDKDTRKLYPELTEDQYAKELITTALGIEGSQIWDSEAELSTWEAFKSWFYDFIRRTFGLPRNEVRALAQEMLSKGIKTDISMLEDIDQQLKSKRPSSSIEKIEKSIDRVYKEVLNRVSIAYNVQVKRTESAKQRERANVNAGIKTRLLSVTELKDHLERYDTADKRKGLIKYLRWAGKEINTMNTLLDERKGNDDVSIEAIRKASEWNDSFNMVEETQKLLEKMHADKLITDKERDSMRKVVTKIQATRSEVEAKLITFAREEYAKIRAKTDTEIYERYKQGFKEDWQALEKSGGASMQEGEYILMKMDEWGDTIKQEALDFARDRAEESLTSLSWLELQVMSEKSMKSKDIQMVSTIIDGADSKIEQFAMDEASYFNTINKAHGKDVSNSRDQKKKYKGMFVTTKSGQSYYTNRFSPEFLETKNELRKHADNADLAMEQYKETEVIPIKDSKGNVFNHKYMSSSAKKAMPLAFEFAEEIRAVSKSGGRPTHVTYKKQQKNYTITLEEAMAKSELNHWMNANTVKTSNAVDADSQPINAWLSDEYAALTPVQKKSLKELTDSVIEADARYDASSSLITEYGNAKFIRLPGAMASDVQRVQSGQKIGLVKQKVKELYKTQADEYDVQGVKAHANIANQEQLRVPIPYRARLKEADQSFDLHTITLMNSVMSKNYEEKKSIESLLLIIDMVAKDKTYPIYDKNGKQATNSAIGSPLYKKNENNKISEKITSIIENRLYGVKTKQAPNLNENIETQKVVQSVMKYFGAVSLIGNWANSIVNTTTGTISNLMEAIGGDVFTLGDWKNASTTYMKDLKSIMADMGSNVVTSKTNMLMSSFNIMGGMEYIQQSFEENTVFEGLMNQNSLRPFAKAGEHMMQGKVMYAVLKSIKVQNAKGQWINSEGKVVKTKKEAASMDQMISYEKVGKNNAKKLVLDPLVQNTSFTSAANSQEQIMLETRNLIKSKIIELHGNYDADLQAHGQRYILGKMVFFLRKWMEPGLLRRWRGAKNVLKNTDDLSEVERYYSADQKENLEGYYATGLRFGINLVKALKEGRFELIKNFDNLSDKEKANLRKLLFEMSMIALTLLAYGALDDEDDPDKNITARYLLRRQQSELMFFSNPLEAFKIVSTPTAAVGNLKSILKVLDQVITDPRRVYEQGPKKDENVLLDRMTRLAPRIKGEEEFKEGLKFLNNMSM
jgi:hypothetical protein